jgi:hypothetical protein
MLVLLQRRLAALSSALPAGFTLRLASMEAHESLLLLLYPVMWHGLAGDLLQCSAYSVTYCVYSATSF